MASENLNVDQRIVRLGERISRLRKQAGMSLRELADLTGVSFTTIQKIESNAISRYVFLRLIIWAEEILTSAMAWTVILGATLVTRLGRRLKMEAIYHLVPSRIKWSVNLFINLSFLAFWGFVVYHSSKLFRFLAGTGWKGAVSEIPMVIPHGPVVLGFTLVLFILVRSRQVTKEEAKHRVLASKAGCIEKGLWS
ncbi:MAG: TRAP transporter small permease subunit [Nitrospinota bacterium]